ncbi:MAG: DUF1080 domain-containing protein [Verrucomicrobia bacterium]|nr:DUF1080 domain-containing protein [Verrucomicrobiota bacterium]
MITRRHALRCLTAAVVAPTFVARAAGAPGSSPTPAGRWQSLFDGRSLAGWKPTAKSGHSTASNHTTAGHWRVEDGMIVGSQDTPNNGGLLLTGAEFGDVEIALETRNDFGMDSGIFTRCTVEGAAYQCLIDYYENGTIGGILGERIWKVRGVRNYSFGPTPDIITLNDHPQRCPVLPDAWKFFWHVNDWNEVRVRIVGDPPTVTTWVNGVQILQHTEPTSVHPARGHIGLQIHGGARSKGLVRYRNIRAREL